VCFLLDITAVDSIYYNLPFERFLSALRDEEPDIDVDFESRRRGNTKRRFAAHAIDRIMPRDSSRETAPWTAEEDEKLLRLNRTHGNRWSDIAKVMGTRSGQQCAQRWRHKVNPNIRRERWSAEEDAKVRMRARRRVRVMSMWCACSYLRRCARVRWRLRVLFLVGILTRLVSRA